MLYKIKCDISSKQYTYIYEKFQKLLNKEHNMKYSSFIHHEIKLLRYQGYNTNSRRHIIFFSESWEKLPSGRNSWFVFNLYYGLMKIAFWDQSPLFFKKILLFSLCLFFFKTIIKTITVKVMENTTFAFILIKYK